MDLGLSAAPEAAQMHVSPQPTQDAAPGENQGRHRDSGSKKAEFYEYFYKHREEEDQ